MSHTTLSSARQHIGLRQERDRLRRHAGGEERDQQRWSTANRWRRGIAAGRNRSSTQTQRAERQTEQRRRAACSAPARRPTPRCRRGTARPRRPRAAPRRRPRSRAQQRSWCRRATASPAARISPAISRPCRAIQTLCQVSITTARPRIAALNSSWPDAGERLREAPANSATTQAPSTPASDAAADPPAAAGDGARHRQHDADDQAGLEHFAKDDDQCGEHGDSYSHDQRAGAFSLKSSKNS